MVCWCPKNDGCCVRSIFLQNHYSTYCDLFISPLYLRLMSSLSAAPPLPKCHRSWWILWLHAFGPCCCIQTSMEGRHCCVPNTSHVAEALRRLPYGRKRSLVIKNDCAGLFASNLQCLCLTWRCCCRRPLWWSRMEDRSSPSVGESDLWEERSHSHQVLAGTEIHLSDTALPYLSSEVEQEEIENMWHEFMRGNIICLSLGTLKGFRGVWMCTFGQPDILSMTRPLQ